MNIRRPQLALETTDTCDKLSDAYGVWLRAPHPNKPAAFNEDRSTPDLLNHKRSLNCFAAGFRNNTKTANQLPLAALEIAESLVVQYVSQGATLLASYGSTKQPSKKTISNLVSCLRALRSVVLKDRDVPIQGKSAQKRLAELPKRKSRVGFQRASWPTRFSADWQEYRTWKIKRMLTPSEGAAYRRGPCRARTIDDAHVSSINGYIGFLVRKCGMSSFGLVEACDPERFGEFINWHLSQDADGGYVHLKHLAAVLATISQYLVARRAIPELTDGKKPWDVFYDIGREIMRLGASSGYIVTAPDVGNWKPSDLHQIGEQGWNQPPIQDKQERRQTQE